MCTTYLQREPEVNEISHLWSANTLTSPKGWHSQTDASTLSRILVLFFPFYLANICQSGWENALRFVPELSLKKGLFINCNEKC